MTLTTRTAAKGIPPRVRSPAGKGNKKVAVAKTKEKRQRDDDEISDSSKYRKKKTKKRSKSSEDDESQVEVVEDDERVSEDPEIVIDNHASGVSAIGNDEVSNRYIIYIMNLYSQCSRETSSPDISVAKNLKRSQSKKI